MPLLNIIDFTCMNQTYYISFTFLRNEIEESYIWVLLQLKDLL
jgi:hypothetical protein